MFSDSDGWYLLIRARYKYLMSVYSSLVENKRRNRLKNVYSQSKTEHPISAEKALVQPRISMENGGAIRKAPWFLARRAAR